ncbi:hybrid signal transduction histidine kinase M [Tanacetum coccineum]|uniref:Hybrid signal transduction histidine kinase M n=1 Tax=Tanacetum coccineum TaxID=301880 RepID=A0ABQ5GKK3_9ASTR
MTLSDTLQARLVVEHPQSAKKAWDLITEIFNDNKRSHTIALKAELRSLKLGDLTIDAYFRKIESIATILISLGSPFTSEDVVTFALEGLPDKYENVCGIITHRDPFPDLKTAHSMLTTEEMWLKSKSQSLPVDSSSSSPMVLMAESGTNRRSSTPQVKSWRPCYNFAKGSCRFGDTCKFVHDAQAKSSTTSLWSSSSNANGVSNSQGNTTNKLLAKLLGQLGTSGITCSNNLTPNNVTRPQGTSVPLALNSNLVTYHTTHSPAGFQPRPAHQYSQRVQLLANRALSSRRSSPLAITQQLAHRVLYRSRPNPPYWSNRVTSSIRKWA